MASLGGRAWIFRTYLGVKWRFWKQNGGSGGRCDIDPSGLVFTLGGSYVFANFGESRSRNATVRVLADGQTDRQTQTDFIIYRMLYAIAMGQIITQVAYCIVLL